MNHIVDETKQELRYVQSIDNTVCLSSTVFMQSITALPTFFSIKNKFGYFKIFLSIDNYLLVQKVIFYNK